MKLLIPITILASLLMQVTANTEFGKEYNRTARIKCEEGSGSSLFDSVLQANRGTVFNMTWAAGKQGNLALNLNGVSSKATINNADNSVLPAGNAPFSVSLWFYANSF